MLCTQWQSLLPLPPQLHSWGEADIEQLRLEEAALQRRHKLQGGEGEGLGRGGRRRGVQEALADIQRQRKEMGELEAVRGCEWEEFGTCWLPSFMHTMTGLACHIGASSICQMS